MIMKLSTLVCSCAGAVSLVGAYPGMEKILLQIQSRQNTAGLDSTELIGDLQNLTDAQLSATGAAIKSIITGSGQSGQSNDASSGAVPALGTPQCAADTCCVWSHVAAAMATAFRGQSGRCNNLAREAVRIGFHDAAGFSKATGPGGGADGSIVLAAVEMTRPANLGLAEIVAQLKSWKAQFGVGMADLIQMAATTATVVCPLGPRVRSFVGRPDSSVPCPDGLLPSPFSAAPELIQLFQNKTIEPAGLASLLGAHTSSQQRFVDPARAGDPQDSTPGVWDVLYYSETLAANVPPRVFKFPSDISLSQDARSGPVFQAFAGAGGQQKWNEAYAREYVRLSLLSVPNINNLTECTKVLPPVTGAGFTPSDQAVLDRWVNTTQNIQPFASAVLNADVLSPFASLLPAPAPGRKQTFTASAPVRTQPARKALPKSAPTTSSKPVKCKRGAQLAS